MIKVLEEVEDDQIIDVEFIEASSCTGGCIGGPLTVEKNFIAKTKIQCIELPQKQIDDGIDIELESVKYSIPIKYQPISSLDSDMGIALQKMDQIKQIRSDLPGLDCGSCGAPSCLALAEDIVRGFANELSCIFKLKEKIGNLANEMVQLNQIGFGQGNQIKIKGENNESKRTN